MRQPSQIRRCREVGGVYMRNRNLGSFEYFNTAVAIRNDVTRLVTSGAGTEPPDGGEGDGEE